MAGNLGKTRSAASYGKTKPPPKPKEKKAEVDGPFRSQSSVPSIRHAATPHEHRTAATTVAGAEREAAAAPAPRKATRTRPLSSKPHKAPSLAKVLASLPAPPTNPATALSLAKAKGIQPPASMKREYGEKPYRKAERAATDYLAGHEGLKEDPIAELAISTAATAGLGGLASLAGKAGAEGASAVGVQLASKEATAGSTIAEKALKLATAGSKRVKAKPGNVVRDVKSAPARTARRIKETPQRVKTAPARAKKAAATPEGRRAAAKSAARHPVRTGYPAVAALPGEGPGGISKRARAAAEGTVSAILHHPGETAKTTLRSLPAAITAPAALLGAAGESVIHGTPAPLEKTASEQAKDVAQIASNAFSGDPKKAEQAARKEGSLAFITPLPAVSRLKSYERGRTALREGAAAVRGKLATKGEAANRSIRHAPTEQSPPGSGGASREEDHRRDRQGAQGLPHRPADPRRVRHQRCQARRPRPRERPRRCPAHQGPRLRRCPPRDIPRQGV
jgi:hypothetical protein